MFRRCVLLAAALTVLAWSTVSTGQAAPTLAAVHPVTAPSDPGDSQDVEAFMDGFVSSQLAIHRIAGATVSVVKDGKVVLVKGYGYADYAAREPVDGRTTLFRLGSISKLFVWTAVMHLVEQGKIDLNADVNSYLKTFKIPDAFGKPVTMLNLMTHTPGFEDSARDLFVDKPSRLQPLGGYLSTHIPARIYPPGTIAAYSNYGAALAGYVVEQVSGEPFDQYVAKHILAPLQMGHTTFQQPLPDALQADMSQGYVVNGGQFTAADFELVNAYPAGGLSATADDMTHFMIAHLAGGEYDGAHILQPQTVALMDSQAWTPSPDIEGMAHGFYAATINGQRIIQHSGDTQVFHSEVTLIPDQKIGLFVSYNSGSGVAASGELQTAFMDRYFPADHTPPQPPAGFQRRLSSYVGAYGQSRINASGPERLTGLLNQVMVRPGPDDMTLLVTSIRAPGTVDQWVEARPGVFKLVGEDDTLVFLDERNGQYQTVYFSSAAPIAGLREPWYDATGFGVSLAVVCLVLFLTGVLAAPVGLFGPRVKPVEGEDRRGLRLAARWAGFGLCLLIMVYLVAFLLLVRAVNTNFGQSFGPLDVLVWLARLEVPLALGMIGLSFFVWRKQFWSLAGRIHYTLIGLAAVAFIWFELVWRLLG